MITLLTAYTYELENPQKAVEEILGQLDIENRRLKNTVALIFCHSAFIEQGVMAAVTRSLPCEVLGCTSQYFAVKETADDCLLTVGILTSDDILFAAGVSEPLGEYAESRIERLYRETSAALGGQPSFILALQPTLLTLGGDAITTALDRACGEKIPIFGTCAMDADIKLRSPRVFYQGTAYQDRAAVLLMSGPVTPRFFSAFFPEKILFAQDAIITGANGNQITSINNAPASAFAEELGLIQDGASNFLYAVPLLVDYRDGNQAQVALINGVDSGGALICSRNVRPGATLNIGSITADYVLETARTLTRSIMSAETGAGLFLFSCFSRVVALGGDPLAETSLVRRKLEQFPAPYLMCYSGGEICPQLAKTGEIVNRFHQYALIGCLL